MDWFFFTWAKSHFFRHFFLRSIRRLPFRLSLYIFIYIGIVCVYVCLWPVHFNSKCIEKPENTCVEVVSGLCLCEWWILLNGNRGARQTTTTTMTMMAIRPLNFRDDFSATTTNNKNWDRNVAFCFHFITARAHNHFLLRSILCRTGCLQRRRWRWRWLWRWRCQSYCHGEPAHWHRRHIGTVCRATDKYLMNANTSMWALCAHAQCWI